SPKLVLVTGGLGYIGSHVVLSLLLTGRYLPVVIDNCANGFPEALKRCIEISRDALGPKALVPKFHQVDLTNQGELENVFEEYKGQGGIWGVVHLAALKAVGESGEKPLDYYRVNVSGSLTLLETMAKYGARRFVFSSSATVYGTPPHIPIKETSPIQPESVYGRTKAMVENIIQDTCRATFEEPGSDTRALKAVSVRYFNPAGAHPSGRLGEEPRGKPGNLLPLLAQIAVGREKSELKVFGNDFPTPDGTCVRDYLHIMDLAHGHILALDALDKPDGIFASLTKKDGLYRAFNLGRGKGMSVLEMIAAMAKATGFKYEYEIVGRRTGDVPDLTADPSQAQKELGFLAEKGLEEMCRDLWNFQQQHPQGYSS
ncbi:GALE epimerase, partial [Spelaeornis formosus]|nr:GALE epimerase [Elachura formosa]